METENSKMQKQQAPARRWRLDGPDLEREEVRVEWELPDGVDPSAGAATVEVVVRCRRFVEEVLDTDEAAGAS
jgi:hypothetical protein